MLEYGTTEEGFGVEDPVDVFGVTVTEDRYCMYVQAACMYKTK